MADQTIESAFSAAIASGAINGAIVLAYNKNPPSNISPAFSLALGQRTLLSGVKVPQSPSDILFLASATKLITTIAALQCVDAGLISLTAPLPPDLVPSLSSKQVLTTPKDGSPTLTPQNRPISLANLLSHTSGLTYDFLCPALAAWRTQNEPPYDGNPRPVEKAFSYPLTFHPGEGWMYGPSLDFAGRVVETVTGQSLGEFVREKICTPLEIPEQECQFFPVQGEEIRSRMVDLNPDDREGLGKAVLGGDGSMNLRSEGDFGGHGLFMTGEGYLEVLKSLLIGDERLLKRGTADRMFENWVREEAEEGFRTAVAGPMGEFFRVGVGLETKFGYGLGGLLTLEGTEGWYGERTLTWGGGMTFSWFVDRANGICALAAIQAALPVDGKVVSELKDTFRHDIYRKYEA